MKSTKFQFQPELSVTSWFIKPRSLLVYRGFATIYSWIILIGRLIESADYLPYFFWYFTNWSFLGLTIYFTAAFYHSARYVKTRTTVSFDQLPKFVNWIFWILYHTIVHFHGIVVIVYWTFLFRELRKNTPPVDWWLMTSVHGGNFLFMMVELFLNKQKVAWRFGFITVFILLLYTFEAWLIYAVTKFWVYPFLNFNIGPIAAVWYIGLLLFFIIIYVIVCWIHKFRDFLGKKYGSGDTKQDAAMEQASI